MSYSQDKRSIRITTTLGNDEIILKSFQGMEALSEPFRFDLHVVSESADLPIKDLLQQPMTVSILLPDGETWRHVNGLVRRCTQGARDTDGMTAYRIELVPWLWFLGLTSNCRIFQELSTQEIITKVFDELGYSDYEFRNLAAGQEPRTYCVQYRESAFNFVSRLLEEDGIFYFFEHHEDRHVLVMADSPVEHPPCTWQSTIRCTRTPGPASTGESVVTELSVVQDVQTSKVAVQDFNFEMPSTSLMSSAGDGLFEHYDFPGGHQVIGKGDEITHHLLLGHTVASSTIKGSSNAPHFSAGHRVTIEDFYRDDLDKDQVIREVRHVGHQPLGTKTNGSLEPFQYSNNFVAFPASATYRPPRRSRKPVITGAQTAIVTGKAGEEIWTDQYGRIKVQFHWDREGQKDENTSCWIRVAQNWAGKKWGAFFLPRIGQEVIVDFLEGDPDRPIVVGSVHNAEQMPPYPLPGEQTKSTIKSNSSKGGGGFNEFRFEDKAGEEEVFLHGQKDWTITILNDKNQTVGHDETGSVGNDRTRDVGHDEKVTVGNDQSVTVGNDQSVTVANDRTVMTGNNDTLTVGADRSVTVASNETRSIGVNETVTIGANREETVGANKTITVGAVLTENVALAHEENVGAGYALSVGAAVAIDAGAAVTVNAGLSLSESCGGSMSLSSGKTLDASAGKDVTMGAGKDVTIKAGKKMMLEATDEITLKAGSATIQLKKSGDIIVKGAKITLKGSGDVVIKGSKVDVN